MSFVKGLFITHISHLLVMFIIMSFVKGLFISDK